MKVIVLSKRPLIRNDPKLCDQLREASRSASRNIAEGFARFKHKEFAHFARIAKASEVELIDHFQEAFDSGYITAEEHRDHEHAVRRALKAVIGLIRSSNRRPTRRRDGGTRPSGTGGTAAPAAPPTPHFRHHGTSGTHLRHPRHFPAPPAPAPSALSAPSAPSAPSALPALYFLP